MQDASGNALVLPKRPPGHGTASPLPSQYVDTPPLSAGAGQSCLPDRVSSVPAEVVSHRHFRSVFINTTQLSTRQSHGDDTGHARDSDSRMRNARLSHLQCCSIRRQRAVRSHFLQGSSTGRHRTARRRQQRRRQRTRSPQSSRWCTVTRVLSRWTTCQPRTVSETHSHTVKSVVPVSVILWVEVVWARLCW